ncbi:MAG: M28 family peptidase, partial [Anaerolineae bacterium]|nr:M28 family peptidase [Anaerolineae bacterium]
QVLSAHVLPNVWPTMVSLAFLEMGAVLMILGELGFLGVFIGGGLGADGEYGLPAIIYYDVPEWSVMLANSWRSFRSHPWATLYPGLAFFLAILGFLFLGEGLRWLTERLTLTFRGLFNRYTMAALLVATLGTRWMLRSTSLYNSFAPSAEAFNGAKALQDVRTLSDVSFEGRLAGTEGADRAAEWIAERFEQLGLQPAGDNHDGFYQNLTENYRVFSAPPSLVLRSPDGAQMPITYGSDFVEHIGRYDIGGVGAGEIVIVASGAQWVWDEVETARKFGISRAELEHGERVILQVWPQVFRDGQHLPHAGLLTMAQDNPVDDASEPAPVGGYALEVHRYEMPAWEPLSGIPVPHALVSRELVERLLPDEAPALEELVQISREGEEAIYIPTGWRAALAVPTKQQSNVPVRNVIAFWPGKDMIMDSDAVIVTAHYDGLGRHPDGTLYPGANDNASGIATMLEMIRTLKQGDYAPKRTIIFVAWVGREFHEPVDVERFLEARIGFAEAYNVIAAIQIEGVGAGTGESAVIWQSSSERLHEVVRRSARQVRTPLATHAMGLHADPEVWPAPKTESPSVTITWAGSDALAHRPVDTVATIDTTKLDHVGHMLALSVMVLASDPGY